MSNNPPEITTPPDTSPQGRRTGLRLTMHHAKVPLQCVADSEGMMPFDAKIVDISPEGLGFLVHPAEITLAPGTLLQGCLVEIPGKRSYKFDLEVCYSQSAPPIDGVPAMRSGCRFVNADDSTRELIELFLSFQPED